MNEHLKIGAAYVRVSTDDQAELSPDAQIRVIMDAAKADGYYIPKEFIFAEEKGISGRKADNRPEFQRMISTAKAQKPAPFSRLYLWKFSRFARNQDESTFYKGILRKKCGVEIKSVSEPIAEGMFGRLIESIIEWFDEYYSYNLSGEVLRGMTEKALREGYQLSPCLGYDAVGQGRPFVINEEKYAIAEFIFHYYYHGHHDMTATAREANRRGYRTRRGGPFERRTVHRILTNNFYNGTVTWNGISFQGTHETRPSITEIFPAVQERIKSEYHPRGRRDASANAHWLSGLLMCGTCGGSLGFNRSSDPKKRPSFFQCWKYSKGFHPESCAVSARIAENAVLKSLKDVAERGELDYEYLPSPNPIHDDREALITEALERLKAKERRIRDAYEGGVDTLEEYKENKARLAAEKADLLQELDTLHQAAEEPTRPSMEEVMARILNVYDLVSDPTIDNETKSLALRSVLKKIVFHRNTGEFSFYYYMS